MKKLIILLSIYVNGCAQIESGQIGVETHWGKAETTAYSPGVYFYNPISTTMYKLNTKVQTVEQYSQAASKDLQNVNTQITLNYHLGAQNPVEHYVRLGADQGSIEVSIVKPAMSETFKAIVAQYNAEELIVKRELVSNAIVNFLNNKLKQYDLYVDSVSITNFSFSDAYSKAIEAKQVAKQVAEQHASKAINDLTRIKVEAQQKIVEAQATATSMSLQRQVVTPELIQLKQLEIQSKMLDHWDGRLPTTMLGNNATALFNVSK